MLYIIGRKVLLLGLHGKTVIRSSGEKSVKFHEDHSLVAVDCPLPPHYVRHLPQGAGKMVVIR